MRFCRVDASHSGPFHAKANICIACHKAYLKNWRKQNRSYCNTYLLGWKNENRAEFRKSCRKHHATQHGNKMDRDRKEKTWRTWFGRLMSAMKAHSIKPGPHDPKSGPRRDFDLTLEYLVGLCEKQRGFCAVTGLPMSRKMGNMSSASIDRIDPKQGHIQGNIHIVCQWVNYARRHYPLEDLKACLNAYADRRYELRRRGELRRECEANGLESASVEEALDHKGAK